jgi:hypothetical protein
MRILGVTASGIVGFDPSYELISTSILPSNQSSVVFSNLGDYSSTYKHLQIRAAVRSTRAVISSDIGVQFNTNTTGYFWHEIQGNGSIVEGGAVTATSSMRLGMASGATAAANAFSPMVIDLLEAYSTTKNKTFRGLTGVAEAPRIRFTSGSLVSTNSVTEIKLLDLFGSFVSGSRFSIYGVK